MKRLFQPSISNVNHAIKTRNKSEIEYEYLPSINNQQLFILFKLKFHHYQIMNKNKLSKRLLIIIKQSIYHLMKLKHLRLIKLLKSVRFC
jgi:hypothetical protein